MKRAKQHIENWKMEDRKRKLEVKRVADESRSWALEAELKKPSRVLNTCKVSERTVNGKTAKGQVNNATETLNSADGSTKITDGRQKPTAGQLYSTKGSQNFADGSQNTAKGRRKHADGSINTTAGRVKHADGTLVVRVSENKYKTTDWIAQHPKETAARSSLILNLAACVLLLVPCYLCLEWKRLTIKNNYLPSRRGRNTLKISHFASMKLAGGREIIKILFFVFLFPIGMRTIVPLGRDVHRIVGTSLPGNGLFANNIKKTCL